MNSRRHSSLLLEKNDETVIRVGLGCEADLARPLEGPPHDDTASTTLRIISTAALIFICYFTIGLQLAVVPGLVHWQLGYSPLVAGFVVSAQYAATLASRPFAGRMGDVFGGKQTTCWGLAACAASGLVLVAAVSLRSAPLASLCGLIVSRLILGLGESGVATGATIWGMGRVGAANTHQVISWSGIASYGALAAGAPAGIWLDSRFGPGALGVVGIAAALAGTWWASTIAAVPILPGKGMAFRRVFESVFPYGLVLALGGIGFGTIASFLTLYFADRHWQDAGLSLTFFGVSFVAVRLLFTDTITNWGGHRVALVSLSVECAGLILLWLAPNSAAAHAGVALAGCGFALVFPALGVEAVRNVSLQSRGSALGIFTAFVDLSLGISGPVAGAIVSALGYPPIFLFAAVMAVVATGLLITLYRKALRASEMRDHHETA